MKAKYSDGVIPQAAVWAKDILRVYPDNGAISFEPLVSDVADNGALAFCVLAPQLHDAMHQRFSSYLLVALLLSSTVLVTGCAAVATPIYGGLYTEVQAPLQVTPNEADDDLLVGRAMAESYLGLIATGDASIRAAMEDGGITEVVYVDYESTSILGLYATFTVVVYGR